MGIINLPWTSGILSTLFFLSLNTSAVAATYTVDSNNVNNVITAAKPGDVIVFRTGTYSNVNINFNANGTATNPITLRAQSPLGVTFNGASTKLTVQGNWLIVDGFRFLDIQHSDDRPVLAVYGSSHSIVRNNEFKNSGRVAGTSTGIMRVAQGSTYNTITHNRFDNVKSKGIQIWAYQSDLANPHNTISWNQFINNVGSTLLEIGGEDADYYTVIENNLFENSCVDSCGGELISNKSSYNIYRFNTFRNTGGRVILRLGQGVTVDSNFFITSSGLRVYDINHRIVNNYFFGGSNMSLWAGSIQGPESPPGYYVAAHNAFVTNNTFLNIGSSSPMLMIGYNYGYNQPGYGVWKYAPQNVVVWNNVMVNDGGTAINDQKSINTKWANNIVWPTKTGKAGYTGPGVTVRDPKLAGTSQPYHILSASPAINAGVAVSSLKYDMDGQPRVGAPDVGSDEWSTAPVVRNPLTASQVGPPSVGPSDTTPPSVSLTEPASGATVSGTITVAATALDNLGVLGVQFKLDGVNLGSEDLTTPYSVAFPTTGVPNGPHSLTALARDAAGNTKTSSAITVTVNNDTARPTVSITAPTNGATVSGTVTVAATAADNAGVVDVQFRVDGILIAQDATAPYTTAWTTTGLGNGSHTLTAIARDAAGNTTTSSPVTVSSWTTACTDPGACSINLNFENGTFDPLRFNNAIGSCGPACSPTVVLKGGQHVVRAHTDSSAAQVQVRSELFNPQLAVAKFGRTSTFSFDFNLDEFAPDPNATGTYQGVSIDQVSIFNLHSVGNVTSVSHVVNPPMLQVVKGNRFNLYYSPAGGPHDLGPANLHQWYHFDYSITLGPKIQSGDEVWAMTSIVVKLNGAIVLTTPSTKVLWVNVPPTSGLYGSGLPYFKFGIYDYLRRADIHMLPAEGPPRTGLFDNVSLSP